MKKTREKSRKQLDRVLRKHYGSKAQIADAAGIARCSVSNWLAGRSESIRIERAVRVFVARLEGKR